MPHIISVIFLDATKLFISGLEKVYFRGFLIMVLLKSLMGAYMAHSANNASIYIFLAILNIG